MSDLQQTLLISGSIFAVMMATQYGRRDFSFRRWAYPLISCAGFAFFYLNSAPTAPVAFVVYLVGALIGAAAGVVAARATKVERAADGTVFTRCGKGFAATWLLMSMARIAFVIAVEHDESFRNTFGMFLFTHQIPVETIPPFFVLMALSMVVVRLAIVMVRVRAARSTSITVAASARTYVGV